MTNKEQVYLDASPPKDKIKLRLSAKFVVKVMLKKTSTSYNSVAKNTPTV